MKQHFLSSINQKSTEQILFIVLFLESLAIALAISGAIAAGHSAKAYFEEGGYMSILSCLQLLGAGILARKIYLIAKKSSNSILNKSSLFWKIVSFGLIFLTLDDAFQIHENIDRLFHFIFDILFDFQETRVSDLIDDLIVGIYLVFFLIYAGKQWPKIEFYRPSFTYFKIGLLLTAMMIFFDAISNNNLFVSTITENLEVQKLWKIWLSTLEDSLKIYAEGFFLVGIYKSWQIAKSLSQGNKEN